jgi:hypothetical protein
MEVAIVSVHIFSICPPRSLLPLPLPFSQLFFKFQVQFYIGQSVACACNRVLSSHFALSCMFPRSVSGLSSYILYYIWYFGCAVIVGCYIFFSVSISMSEPVNQHLDDKNHSERSRQTAIPIKQINAEFGK